jgi:hypothetical protein
MAAIPDRTRFQWHDKITDAVEISTCIPLDRAVYETVVRNNNQPASADGYRETSRVITSYDNPRDALLGHNAIRNTLEFLYQDDPRQEEL